MRRLVIMVTLPRPGCIKTRLAANIGNVPAAHWYRQNCRRVIRQTADPRWQTLLAVTPDDATGNYSFWPPHLARLPQGTGNLGARLRRVFLHLPPDPVIVIGSDIPEASADAVQHAFSLLDPRGAVFGPSPDGGYWLVGIGGQLRNRVSLFKDVRWSSPHALTDSIKSLAGAPVRFARELRDVDTVADL